MATGRAGPHALHAGESVGEVAGGPVALHGQIRGRGLTLLACSSIFVPTVIGSDRVEGCVPDLRVVRFEPFR